MPYNSETETFYQAPATVVDSTPDGDTVQEGFDDRLTPALAGVYADFNLLKADGMISVGIPATTTARGIGRVATSADLVDGATINNGPAFLAAGVNTSVAAAANRIPIADANGRIPSAWLSFAAPTGLSAFWHGSTPPPGWLEKNGAAISRTAHPKLFALLGTQYGAGDGSTTFNLPDDRGIFIRAWDHGRGVDSGRGFGTYQEQAIPYQEGGFRYDTMTVDAAWGACSRIFSGGGGWVQRTGDNSNAREIKIAFGSGTDLRSKNMAYMSIIKDD